MSELLDARSTSQTDVRLSEVLPGLSYALDLTEGQRPGHSVRTCAIGMRLAEVLGLSQDDRSALFYALLMKDLGCSSNAARFAALFAADDRALKSNLVLMDWPRALESFRFVALNVAPGGFWLRRVWQALAVFSRGPQGARDVVRTRCERGAEIATMLGFADQTVQAIRALDEHWDGRGQPSGLERDAIPLLARVVGLAQTFEVFLSTHGKRAAYDMAYRRNGSWFDPDVVDALKSVRGDDGFWRWVQGEDVLREIGTIEPADRVFRADDNQLDVIAEAFAKVIDAKSPWTYRHSTGVASLAVSLATALGMPAGEIRELRRAALLHDLGKLAVSNLILDKPDRLTETEFDIVQRHPKHTEEILGRVACFKHLADLAGAHHERLDGRGYHRGRTARDLSTPARLLCAADVCDALLSSRPYRPGIRPERVLQIMGRDVGTAIDADCFRALRQVLGGTSEAETGQAPAARIVSDLAEDYYQAA